MEILSDIQFQARLLRAVIPALLAVLFLQSGLDKVFDYRGNLSWMTEHFSKTILRGVVPVSLVAITILELASAALCAVGALSVLAGNSVAPAFWGMLLSAVTLLALFAGQRIAKDYAGAASIALYVGLAVLGMLALH
jgi:hypothetical protein